MLADSFSDEGSFPDLQTAAFLLCPCYVLTWQRDSSGVSSSSGLSPFFLSFLFFLGPYLQHMEDPRPGGELELQLLAYTTATATPDPSRHLWPTSQLMAMPDL